MRGPNEARLEREQRSRAARKLRSLGCGGGICSSPFVGPPQRFDPNFSIQTWATGLVERGNIRR